MSKRKLTQKQRVLRDVIAWHDWVVRERGNRGVELIYSIRNPAGKALRSVRRLKGGR